MTAPKLIMLAALAFSTLPFVESSLAEEIGSEMYLDPFGGTVEYSPDASGSLAVIDGTANVRSSPNGQIVFELNDGTGVLAQIGEDNWFKIRLRVYVQPISAFPPSSGLLPANTNLYNGFGQKIGSTKIALQGKYLGNQPTSPNAIVEIQGMTHFQNFKSIDWSKAG